MKSSQSEMAERGNELAAELETTMVEALRATDNKAEAVAIVFAAGMKSLANLIGFASALGDACVYKLTGRAIEGLLLYANMEGAQMVGSPLFAELERLAAGKPVEPWTPLKKEYDA